MRRRLQILAIAFALGCGGGAKSKAETEVDAGIDVLSAVKGSAPTIDVDRDGSTATKATKDAFVEPDLGELDASVIGRRDSGIEPFVEPTADASVSKDARVPVKDSASPDPFERYCELCEQIGEGENPLDCPEDWVCGSSWGEEFCLPTVAVDDDQACKNMNSDLWAICPASYNVVVPCTYNVCVPSVSCADWRSRWRP